MKKLLCDSVSVVTPHRTHRDSFGSAFVPLLVQDYKTVTLVDIRYIQPEVLGKFLEFSDQDVLFMSSALVLNKRLI